jgi:hypothetical protein
MTLKNAGLGDFTAQILSVVTTGNSLKQHYDRNPLVIKQLYASIDAPTVAGTKWSYTVPASRKAFVSGICSQLQRTSAATVVGDARFFITVDSSTYIFLCAVNTNNVGDHEEVNIGNSLLLLVGNVLTGGTSDSSTGGTMSFICSALILEFDA